MKKPKESPLGITLAGSRWQRRSPEHASVEVIQAEDVASFTAVRPKRIQTGKHAPACRGLTFKEVAVLHLALTRQYQRTSVDEIANEYENLLAQLENILEHRPSLIRFH